LISFIVTSYSRYKFTQSDQYFYPASVDLDDIVLATGTTHYRSDQRFTLETWNCVLSKFVPMNATSPSARQLRNLCTQAKAARIMTLPLLLLAAISLIVYFWAWRKHNIANDRARNLAKGKSDWQNDFQCEKGPVQSDPSLVMELPAAEMRMVE
ncbi:hypothetical protein, partial [Staphylococcus aureus]|uniref:hypothetical protein n=1 Tax=Staphylococcus aureus TaxID=1280 RepID=UPI0019D5517D